MLKDDAFGVGEALDEKENELGLVARGKHWLIFGKKTTTSPTLKARERLLANEVLMANWLFFNDMGEVTKEQWTQQYINNVGLKEIFQKLLLIFENYSTRQSETPCHLTST